MIVLDRKPSHRYSASRYAVAYIALAVVALTSGCSVSAREDEPASVDRRREVVSKEKSPAPTRAPEAEAEQAATTGEVPQALLLLFRDDAARRALVQPAAVTVVSATEKQWPDGSMGCPQPGMMYTQMVIPGYRVVLSAAGHNYEYHSDRRGKFILCENGQRLPPASEQTKKPEAQ